MIRGFYSARTGLYAHQENLNVIANNLANVNTVGFKSFRTSFTDLIYQNLNRNTAELPAGVGHGVKVNKTDLNMTQGALQPTGWYLDFAITAEDAFFAVRTASGDIQYTRAGDFILSNDGDGVYYLAAPNGDRVLDAEGEEIEIEFEQIEQRNLIPLEDEDGNIVRDQYGNTVYEEGEAFIVDGQPIVDKDRIGLYRFANPYGLWALGNNRYTVTAASGEAEAIEFPPLREGYLEASGVELATEMVRMIEASKAFSFNSRMVQVTDEVEQTINSLR